MSSFDDLTPEQQEKAEQLFTEMKAFQTCLWDTAGELEDILGVEIDTTFDFETMTVRGLIDAFGEEE